MYSIILIAILSITTFVALIALAWRLNEHTNKETTLDLVANDATKELSKTLVKIPVRY